MEATATVAMEEDESEEDPGLRKTRLAAQKEEEEDEQRRRAEEDEDDPGVFEEEDWERWKEDSVPLMYDWLAHRNLEWPSSSARWGPVLQRCADKVVQRLIYCERTGETDYLNTLVLAKAHVPYGGMSDRQTLGRFSNRGGNSGKLQTEKRILHPGEVNALRLCHQREGLVCTHSDTSVVYVWDTDAAPHAVQNKRRKTGEGSKGCSMPAATLVGHEKMAQYAIDTARKAPYVVSGGQDHLVLLWSLDDLSTAQQWSPGGETRTGPVLYPKSKFCGHTDTVEAVACHPTSIDECCSGGDDKLLLFWDCRQEGHKPAAKVEGVHLNDINCLGWNTVATELVATGDSDGIVRVFDTRSLGSPLHTIGAGSEGYGWLSSTDNLPGHVGSVMTVEWMPHSSTILASGGDDCALRIWDLAEDNADSDGFLPVFAHAGHRHPVVDIDWNEHSPGTLATLSEPTDGGSKLQMWRISETIAETWPLKDGTVLGSIETGTMPERLDRLNLPVVALPQKRKCVAEKATSDQSAESGRRHSTRRTPAKDTVDGGINSAPTSSIDHRLTVLDAALAVMQDGDPENEGMEVRAIVTAIERTHPRQWQAKSLQNMIIVAARKGDRLTALGGRGAGMLVKRALSGDSEPTDAGQDVAEPLADPQSPPGGQPDKPTVSSTAASEPSTHTLSG